jgi:hypothetical protein
MVPSRKGLTAAIPHLGVQRRRRRAGSIWAVRVRECDGPLENAPIFGEKAERTLEEAETLRPQAVAFQLATHLQQHHFSDRPRLFPQLLGIVHDSGGRGI